MSMSKTKGQRQNVDVEELEDVLVVGNCEEFWKLPLTKGKKTNEERRTLGLVLLRGEKVISMTVEGPPPSNDSCAKAISAAAAGPGVGRGAGLVILTAPLI